MTDFIAWYGSIGLVMVLLASFIDPSLFTRFRTSVVILGVLLVMLFWPYWLIMYVLKWTRRK